MLRVALTGSIGSGKTAVSDYLSSLGVVVLDADQFAHEVTARGKDAVDQIAKVLGPAVLGPDGRLDRAAVRELVFADPKKRAQLEAIIHPRVRQKMNEAAKRAKAPYVIFSIPLLVETGQADNFDRVVVVEAPSDLRAKRVLERSGLDHDAFSAINDAQASDADRRRFASDIIHNDGSLQSLHAQVDALDKRLTDLSREKMRPVRK
ncbi:MAG TPA: dephospho-CoA kinase [Gammaproteobacteria bacterium]|nr:dephospho-CoA kinase [Gammaproteobacteria bacterium]|tara:strand:- start:275 stop:892 length:618 start_codon:yes stop_codon:yes gene_type:complete